MKQAIANDPQVYIAREDTRIADDNIDLARSVFRPKVFGELYGVRDDRPPTARTFAFRDEILAGEVGISGELPTGMTYVLTAGLMRQRVESPFVSVYDPGRTATANIELVQPLLRGGFGAARRPIVVASLRKNQSDLELRARLEVTVGNVEVAYWNLVRARTERDARKSALSIATEQVEESKRLRRAGTGSDLDITEAETGVSRRQQELLVSEQDIVDAEGQLLARLGARAGDKGWAASALVPTDVPQLDTRQLDLASQLELARTRRAEVLAARARIAAEQSELAVRDDQRGLALDIVAQAGTTGFAGRFDTTSYATAGVNGGGFDPPYFNDPDYEGTTGSALKNLLGKDTRLYLGLRFEMLLGNDDAEVKHSIQQRTLAKSRLAERQTLVQVETEVRTTVAQVALGTKKVEASEKTVALAEKFLDGMRKRYRAGAATTFDVLRVSEELTRARVEAARVLADYRVTLTRLGLATGTLLESHAVSVKNLGASPK